MTARNFESLYMNIKKLFLVLILFLTAPTVVAAQIVPPNENQPAATQAIDSASLSSAGIPQVRGLGVSPFLLDLDIPKGGTISSTIDIANRSEVPLVITVTPRDFLPGNEGQPEFVPDVTINDPTFSLASWIKLKISTQFTIEPGAVVTVPFTLNPPIDAEQGTHYGALLFSYVGTNAIGNASEVQQSVGTIILVRYGEARENGVVDLIPSAHVLWNADKVTFINKFTNTGNVHVQPKGEVYIKNMWGQIIETPFVNRDAANVLPKTDRSFVNSWYPSSFAFGRYTVETVLQFGRGRLEARDKHIILVLPWYFLIALGVVLAVILWFIFHGRHWHKRRVIKRHLENS